jgi:alpha-beta hydrolase superfamily lysophospholipase
VDHIRAIGPTLGDRVTLAEVPGAMHDVMLSRPEVRARALAVVTEWLDEVLPPAVARPAAP